MGLKTRYRGHIYVITAVVPVERRSTAASSFPIRRPAPESQRGGAEDGRAANLGQKAKQGMVSVVYAVAEGVDGVSLMITSPEGPQGRDGNEQCDGRVLEGGRGTRVRCITKATSGLHEHEESDGERQR